MWLSSLPVFRGSAALVVDRGLRLTSRPPRDGAVRGGGGGLPGSFRRRSSAGRGPCGNPAGMVLSRRRPASARGASSFAGLASFHRSASARGGPVPRTRRFLHREVAPQGSSAPGRVRERRKRRFGSSIASVGVLRFRNAGTLRRRCDRNRRTSARIPAGSPAGTGSRSAPRGHAPRRRDRRSRTVPAGAPSSVSASTGPRIEGGLRAAVVRRRGRARTGGSNGRRRCPARRRWRMGIGSFRIRPRAISTSVGAAVGSRRIAPSTSRRRTTRPKVA